MNVVNALTAMVLICVAVVSARAEGLGQPQRGQSLAERYCAECHAIQRGDARSPNLDAPAFAKIASTPGVTAIALTAALQTSHRTMPNIILQPEEMQHLIAYILSLRDVN
jgi:mono/diheme cytochrome c family protein